MPCSTYADKGFCDKGNKYASWMMKNCQQSCTGCCKKDDVGCFMKKMAMGMEKKIKGQMMQMKEEAMQMKEEAMQMKEEAKSQKENMMKKMQSMMKKMETCCAGSGPGGPGVSKPPGSCDSLLEPGIMIDWRNNIGSSLNV